MDDVAFDESSSGSFKILASTLLVVAVGLGAMLWRVPQSTWDTSFGT